jgi:hypothetical protein
LKDQEHHKGMERESKAKRVSRKGWAYIFEKMRASR